MLVPLLVLENVKYLVFMTGRCAGQPRSRPTSLPIDPSSLLTVLAQLYFDISTTLTATRTYPYRLVVNLYAMSLLTPARYRHGFVEVKPGRRPPDRSGVGLT
jgi:hypothetical protein